MGHFNRAFVDLRRRSGFKTAYSYYSSNGGRRAFPFTYATLLRFERGSSLPSPSQLLILFRSLRRGNSITERGELTRAYLRDLSGSEAVYESLFASTLKLDEEPSAVPTVRDLRARMVYHVTQAQMETVASGPAATAVYALLVNAPLALDLPCIARSLGLPEGRCLAALRALKKAGLARAAGKDSWSGSNPGGSYQMPGAPDRPELTARMADHMHETARRNGKKLVTAQVIARLRLADAQAAVKDLENVLTLAAGRSRTLTPPGPETPVYLLEARVTKLFAIAPPAESTKAAGRGPRERG